MKLSTIALAGALALSGTWSSTCAFAQAGDGGGTGMESAQMSGGGYSMRGSRSAFAFMFHRGRGAHGFRKSHHRIEQR
jgi:hypothetical protein